MLAQRYFLDNIANQLSRTNTVNSMSVHCVRGTVHHACGMPKFKSHAFWYLHAVFGITSVSIITGGSSLVGIQTNLTLLFNLQRGGCKVQNLHAV